MRLRDEQGMMAIGVALMLIVVLPLFGGVLWQYSTAELKRVEKTDQDLQALFLARAGAEMAMAAWKQKIPSDEKPFGKMEPVYYDLDQERFTTSKPANVLGQIDIVISEEDATEDGTQHVTVIEATATVGSTERTVRLVTYPHRYGHDPSLLWYIHNSGEITFSEYDTPSEVVMFRTRTQTSPIYLGDEALRVMSSRADRAITFAASALVFDSPLRLMPTTGRMEGSRDGQFDVQLSAETIFLHGLEIDYMPSAEFLLYYPWKNFRLKLTLPEINGEKLGKRGRDLAGNQQNGTFVDDAWYGEVYFDDESTIYRSYEWYKRSFLSWPDVRVRSDYNLGLAGKAFYFREGSVLDGRAIQAYIDQGNSIASYFGQAAADGWLLPIKAEHQINREDLEGLQPFFWER